MVKVRLGELLLPVVPGLVNAPYLHMAYHVRGVSEVRVRGMVVPLVPVAGVSREVMSQMRHMTVDAPGGPLWGTVTVIALVSLSVDSTECTALMHAVVAFLGCC